MPWRSAWLTSDSRIRKAGNRQARVGGGERMMGISPPTQDCYNHLGPSWPKAFNADT